VEPCGCLFCLQEPDTTLILSHISPGHGLLSHVFEMHLIVPSHLRVGLLSDLFPSGFPTKILYAPHTFPNMCQITLPSRSSWLITRIIFGENSWWSVPLCDLLYSPVTSSLLDCDIFRSTLLSNTLHWACVAPWVSDTEFHERQQYIRHKHIMHYGVVMYYIQ